MPKRPSTQARLHPMNAAQPRLFDWLWPGWIALGKLTVLDGDPGVGKSTLLFDFAARLSRDGVMPDGTAGPVTSQEMRKAPRCLAHQRDVVKC